MDLLHHMNIQEYYVLFDKRREWLDFELEFCIDTAVYKGFKVELRKYEV